MNQLFYSGDIQSRDEASQSIHFPAQHWGALIECYVTKQKALQNEWIDIEDEQEAVEAFLALRFDLKKWPKN